VIRQGGPDDFVAATPRWQSASAADGLLTWLSIGPPKPGSARIRAHITARWASACLILKATLNASRAKQANVSSQFTTTGLWFRSTPVRHRDNKLACMCGCAGICASPESNSTKCAPYCSPSVLPSSHARCSSEGCRALIETYSLALLAMANLRRAVHAP
jgi:hypothetical protein